MEVLPYRVGKKKYLATERAKWQPNFKVSFNAFYQQSVIVVKYIKPFQGITFYIKVFFLKKVSGTAWVFLWEK